MFSLPTMENLSPDVIEVIIYPRYAFLLLLHILGARGPRMDAELWSGQIFLILIICLGHHLALSRCSKKKCVPPYARILFCGSMSSLLIAAGPENNKKAPWTWTDAQQLGAFPSLVKGLSSGLSTRSAAQHSV